jgi:hypothetical protein
MTVVTERGVKDRRIVIGVFALCKSKRQADHRSDDMMLLMPFERSALRRAADHRPHGA